MVHPVVICVSGAPASHLTKNYNSHRLPARGTVDICKRGWLLSSGDATGGNGDSNTSWGLGPSPHCCRTFSLKHRAGKSGRVYLFTIVFSFMCDMQYEIILCLILITGKVADHMTGAALVYRMIKI